MKKNIIDRNLSHDLHECNNKCAPVNSMLASEICNKKIPVIKTIRFCELDKIEEIAENFDLDPKILLLTRDPRGIFQVKIKY